jgi:hypothetical protein
MQSKAPTVEAYLESLPTERREALEALRTVIHRNLDKTFKEGMQYGMVSYFVPHSVYPNGYHCDPRQPLPFAGIASQKNHISVYLMSMYLGSAEEKWFKAAWTKVSSKKLDMGKCCIRFKKQEDIPLALIGEAFRRVNASSYIDMYETTLRTRQKPGTKKPAKTSKPASTNKTLRKGKKQTARKASK